MLVASGMLSTNVCSELRRHYSRGGSTAGGEGTDSFERTLCLIPPTSASRYQIVLQKKVISTACSSPTTIRVANHRVRTNGNDTSN